MFPASSNEDDDDLLTALTDTEKNFIQKLSDSERRILKGFRIMQKKHEREERKRWDWLKFTLFIWEQFSKVCNQIVSEIRSRMK